jgi:hypothetical protein
MFSFISPKFLTFYATVTGAVITLFSVTTAYGEAHLQAQDPIGGRYAIAKSALPACLQAPLTDQAILVLQQSGRYITGELLPLEASAQQREMAAQRPSWIGSWRDRQLSLTATLNGCPASLSIQGPLAKDSFVGRLQMGADTQPLRAVRLAESPTPDNSH